MGPRHVRPRSPTGPATAFLALLQGSFAQAQAYTPDPIPPIIAISEELATDVHWLRQACDTLDAADFAQRSHLAYRVVYLTAIADSVGATTSALTELDDLRILPEATQRMTSAHTELYTSGETFSADRAPTPSQDAHFLATCRCALATLTSVAGEIGRSPSREPNMPPAAPRKRPRLATPSPRESLTPSRADPWRGSGGQGRIAGPTEAETASMLTRSMT